MRFSPNGIPLDAATDEDITPQEWDAVDGALERHLASIEANPALRAPYEALLDEITRSIES